MEKLLLSRIGDLLRAAQRGDTAASPFLTPEEAVRCDEYLKRNEPEAAYRLWGGYDDAERKRLFLLSAYSVFPEEDFRVAATVREVIALGAENVTVHTLALKKGSRFLTEGTLLPDGDAVSAMLSDV